MKYIFKNFIDLNKSFFILLSIFLLSQPIKLNSYENKNYSKLSTKNQENNLSQFKSEYILGSGDEILIIFEGIPEYSRNYSINPLGNLEMPEINELAAAGLTLKELKEKLKIKYEDFIINPTFNLTISTYRTVNVYISGEVDSPGLYELNYLQTQSNIKSTYSFSADMINNNVSKVPTLFDALKLARGVTNNADLSNITIVRENSISQGGGKIKAEINLLGLIKNGDQSQNIMLFDSDYIFVKKSDKIIKDQILAINKTNLNPEKMIVFITGNVLRAGEAEIKKGTSLVQAIASNGGKKIMTGNIEFLRFTKNGVKKRTFRYDGNAPINSDKNPILMDGDIINVRKTLLGSTTEVLEEVSSPLVTGYGLFSLFDKIL